VEIYIFLANGKRIVRYTKKIDRFAKIKSIFPKLNKNKKAD
jgi:hypothetical protein